MKTGKPDCKLATISGFALANGSDRRTVKRRLLAHAIRPAGKIGGYDAYRLADLRRVIQDEPGQPLPNVLRAIAEHAASFILEAAGSVLPDAVAQACDGKLPAVQCNRIAATIWIALACRASASVQADAFNEALTADNAGLDLDGMWARLGFSDESGSPDSFALHTPPQVLEAAKQAGVKIPEVIDLIQNIAGG